MYTECMQQYIYVWFFRLLLGEQGGKKYNKLFVIEAGNVHFLVWSALNNKAAIFLANAGRRLAIWTAWWQFCWLLGIV